MHLTNQNMLQLLPLAKVTHPVIDVDLALYILEQDYNQSTVRVIERKYHRDGVKDGMLLSNITLTTLVE